MPPGSPHSATSPPKIATLRGAVMRIDLAAQKAYRNADGSGKVRDFWKFQCNMHWLLLN